MVRDALEGQYGILALTEQSFHLGSETLIGEAYLNCHISTALILCLSRLQLPGLGIASFAKVNELNKIKDI